MQRFLPTALVVLSLIGVTPVTYSHDALQVCPANPDTAYVGDGINPFDLIWDIDDGTTSQSAGERIAFVLSARPFDAQSTCSIDATVLTFDGDGNVLTTGGVTLDKNQFWGVVEQPFSNSSSHGRDVISSNIGGTATGCTRQELRSLSVAINHLKEISGDDDCIGSGCTETRTTQRMTPTFRRAVPASGANQSGSASSIVSVTCPGNANPDTAYVGGGVIPFDLIWDVAGGTSQSPREKTELLVTATPRLAGLSCRQGPETIVPTATVQVVVSDASGNTETTLAELDHQSRTLVMEIPYAATDGRREVRHVSVSAQTPGCTNGRPFDLSAAMLLVDAQSGETQTTLVGFGTFLVNNRH